MQRFTHLARLLSAATVLILLAAPALALNIKAATSGPQGSQHMALLEKFKELVEQRSGGDLTVTLFPGGQMGSEEDNIKQCASGVIQMTVLASNNVTPFSSAAGIVGLPYIFTNKEDAKKLFNDTAFMQDLGDTIAKNSKTRPLAWAIAGFRVLTNSKRPVVKIDDMKGLRIRVPKTHIMLETYKAWGVEPMPLAWAEVFNALQQGVIDGQDNPYLVNRDNKFFEVQKYITDLHYMLWTGPLLVNEDWYKALKPAQRELIVKAAKEAEQAEWAWEDAASQKALDEMLAHGMVFNTLEDEKVWIDKARALWPSFYAEVGGEEVVKKAMAAIQR